MMMDFGAARNGGVRWDFNAPQQAFEAMRKVLQIACCYFLTKRRAVTIASVNAGTAGDSGSMTLQTGTTTAGASGAITMKSGTGTGGSGGDITISVGSGDTTFGGKLDLSGGESTAASAGTRVRLVSVNPLWQPLV